MSGIAFSAAYSCSTNAQALFPEALMVTNRIAEANGIRFYIREAGQGPLVILCHGFPETSHSWRHQLAALAEAGFHAVAPDMRGYGRTDRPDAIDDYSIFHLTGDVVGLIAALGEKQAIVVGHDWGAAVAWHVALFRPDICRAVVAMSVPFQPRHPAKPPIETFKAITKAKGLPDFYMVRFQEPGIEKGFEKDLDFTIRSSLYGLSGDVPEDRAWSPFEGFSKLTLPERLPTWVTEEDVQAYVEAFRLSGFKGPLNWYRNIDRNWALTAPFGGLKIMPPALFITGSKDAVRLFAGRAEERLGESVPNLKGKLEVEGAGHWVQQEAPAAVNTALLDFIRSI
jgi:pimeloyl-ACP methyl ester carboxylesterase